jgi:hypothetical protein
VGLGFELRALCLQSRSHTSRPFCSGCFGDGISRDYLPGLASNLDPPNLSLPNSSDYKLGLLVDEPPVPSHVVSICGNCVSE